MVNAKAATPAAANKFRKLLSVLMRVAIDTGWRDDNPVTTVKGIRTKSDGFRTWTDEEIAAFRARHQVGTKPRLALELLLCTGQRRGDAVLMGYQHLKNGVLTIRQQKTRIEELQACLNAAPRDHLTF
jgi:integrase